jgi:hypothetical protein
MTFKAGDDVGVLVQRHGKAVHDADAGTVVNTQSPNKYEVARRLLSDSRIHPKRDLHKLAVGEKKEFPIYYSGYWVLVSIENDAGVHTVNSVVYRHPEFGKRAK